MTNLQNIVWLACTIITAALIQPAAAVPINIIDTYEGSDAHGYGDVIGSTSNFQITSMDVSLIGTVLNVNINTNFAGKAGELFTGSITGGYGIGYGDLFLSSAWNPDGDAPYTSDNNVTGTSWTYGLAIDDAIYNRFSGNNTINDAAASLYKLNGATNNANALLSEDFILNPTFRDGQEVAVDTGSASVTDTGINGTWSIDNASDLVSFSIDLAGTDLLTGDEIALHWGFTCANDVIEGAYSVPEPGITALLGIGLLGISTLRYRKRKSL